MRHTTLATLTVAALAATAHAQNYKSDKSGGAPPAVVVAEIKPPRSMIEKNKRAKMDKSSRAVPGLGVRVVGGTKVTDGSKYPFFVEWEDAKCGASLIHDDIALSAAHCENVDHPFNTRVFVNGIASEDGVFRTIERQLSHPLYHPNDLVDDNADYDFMLLKLHRSALVDIDGRATGAETVRLNRDMDVPFDGAKLMAVGYGLTEEGAAATSPDLNDVEVEYIPNEACRTQYGDSIFVPDLMFCAGIPGCEGDECKDTCQGDSGGPIIDQATNTQVGVVSFGIGCARAYYTGVYARVSAATAWIDDMICEMSDYPPARCSDRSADEGIGSGNGDISIDLKYDKYSQETAFSLVHDESGQQLYFQPYNAEGAKNDKEVNERFPDLPAGNYTLMVGDDGNDGMCCGYGSGYLRLIDNKFGGQGNRDEIAWEAASFGEFLFAKFTIDSSGEVKDVEETLEYKNSWEFSPDPKNYPQSNDQAWPGPKPSSAGSLNVNIKFDRNPAENTWKLEKQSGSNWNTVDGGDFDGEEDGTHNDLLSTQFENTVSEGWYRFSITDSGGDGICCGYRRGWVAITGVLKATRKPGLVYGNDGDFGEGDTVYMKVDGNGMFVKITNDESAI